VSIIESVHVAMMATDCHVLLPFESMLVSSLCSWSKSKGSRATWCGKAFMDFWDDP
jgi:hypothetical protein